MSRSTIRSTHASPQVADVQSVTCDMALSPSSRPNVGLRSTEEEATFDQAGSSIEPAEPVLQSHLLPQFSVSSLMVTTFIAAIIASGLRAGDSRLPLASAFATAATYVVAIVVVAVASFLFFWAADRFLERIGRHMRTDQSTNPAGSDRFASSGSSTEIKPAKDA